MSSGTQWSRHSVAEWGARTQFVGGKGAYVGAERSGADIASGVGVGGLHKKVAMQKTHRFRPRWTQMLFAGVLVGLMLLISACGGDTHTQQQANQQKTQLDHLLQHATAIGITLPALQSVLKQEQALSSASAPFSLFNDQLATSYYHNLAIRYQQLALQVQGIIAVSTQQFQSQAQYDMQTFQLALSRVRLWGHFANIQKFSQQFSQDQSLLSTAQYPTEYAAISQNARLATQTLNLVEPTFQRLNIFKQTMAQMQAAPLDVTAMQLQYRADMQAYNTASTSLDLQNLGTLIDAQYQQAVVSSLEALPFVGTAKLHEFQIQLELFKTYGLDASAYQKRLAADQTAIKKASTISAYLAVSKQINTDIASMHVQLLQGEATYLVGEIDREAKAWGQANLYHDKLDGKNYIFTAGYTQDGIGYWLNNDLGAAYTPADYQSVIDQEHNELFNLQMLEADYYDTTPYNQVHATDLQMMDHYQLHHGQVLIISLVEQTMRLYQDGHLVRAFHVTTGRVERPSLPGLWTVQNRQSPTEFKSDDPPSSPFWYPPTPIHYAILYHWGGYYVHDAWWRADYGPGTQFPHYDSGGDETFSGNGSHGCVNMQEDQASWLYANTDWNTNIAIY